MIAGDLRREVRESGVVLYSICSRVNAISPNKAVARLVESLCQPCEELRQVSSTDFESSKSEGRVHNRALHYVEKN